MRLFLWYAAMVSRPRSSPASCLATESFDLASALSPSRAIASWILLCARHSSGVYLRTLMSSAVILDALCG
jgi:hypothetical protein